ncbi:FAD-binding oxidoreductase [Naasia sp. SYSU D00948]|uniref:FAD-binding oxidoreductase n=1 Tax=Naasia sp. SYSU D00948 TaxID=2817379 RepID=UPI001B3154EC|nr:FAD-binding oxidoreductase [Naasia sp. SYSU D00948]
MADGAAVPGTSELSSRAGAEVLRPGDDEYERLRPDYMVAGEPALIVRPSSPEGVAETVRYAAEHGLPISVRSGGHGAAAFANPGGVVIDLARLRDVAVGEAGLVRIGGGATWGEIAAALGRHGLALSSGDTRSVGVGGLTLGGGIGWMVRQYGLALDSLVGAQVVLADGRIVRATASDHADLFWALRGGGGNFGVVTEFTFQAHPVGEVVFGALTFGVDDLPGLLRGWRDVMRGAPEELNTTVLAMPPFGDQPPGVQILVCWTGDPEQADEVVAPLRALPGLRDEQLARTAYADVLEEPEKPEGVTIVDYNSFAADFDDRTIDALAAAREQVDASVLMIRYLRGALNRVPASETAFAHRDSEVLLILAAFLPVDAAPEDVATVRRRWSALDEYTRGMYSNFSMLAGEETTARIYPPDTLARLREVKRDYDPGNLFARNHNVRPAEGVLAGVGA